MSEAEKPWVPLGGPSIQTSEEVDKMQLVDLPKGLIDPTGTRNLPSLLPGVQNRPFRGRNADEKMLKRTDKTKEVSTVHVEILDLWKVEHLKHYEEVMQMVMNGFARISEERKRWIPKHSNWRVFLRWLEDYAVKG